MNGLHRDENQVGTMVWAVITGGSGFLGSVFIDVLVNVGFKVLNLDVNPPQKIHSDVVYKKCDISDLVSVKNSITSVIRVNEIVGALVHCAFIDNKIPTDTYGDLSTELTVNPEVMRLEFNVALLGSLTVTQAVLPFMKPYPGGRPSIVFIGSDLSVISPDQNVYVDEDKNQRFVKNVSYTSMKHGILGAVKHLATQLAWKEIRVNCMSPGPIEAQQPDFVKDALRKRIPMNRLLKVEELKGPLRFLVTEDSSFVTGQNLVIDGGRTIW